MNLTWALQLDLAMWRAAATLRLRDPIRGGCTLHAIWLTGDELTEELELELRKLGGRRFTLSPRGELTLPGERSPSGVLPQLDWVPLREFIAPISQTSALPGKAPEPTALSLVHGGDVREANVLLAAGSTWAAYAVGAPMIRLKPLTFAANATSTVLIRGTPLPPISGRRFVEEAGIAIPCGLRWEPRVSPRIIASRLHLSPGDLALFETADHCELIGANSFVVASRSAVRLSMREGAR